MGNESPSRKRFASHGGEVRRRCGFTFLVATVAGAASAHAAIISFSNLGQFTAATQGLQTITFEGLVPAGQGYKTISAPSTNPLVLTGPTSPAQVKFIDASNLYAVTTGFGAINNDGSTSLSFDGTAGGSITLPTGITAVGFNIFSSAAPNPSTFEIYTSDKPNTPTVVTTFPQNANASNPSYVGFVDNTPGSTITNISFDQNYAAPATDPNSHLINNTPAIDNFSFGQAIPEPTTVATAAIGLTGFGLHRRRRQMTPSEPGRVGPMI